jgi:hypothetical protein
MRTNTDELLASIGISAAGFVFWVLFLSYLSTKHLQPLVL